MLRSGCVVTIVEHIYRESEMPESSRAYGPDTITLGWEERQQAHGRRTSDGGVQFGVSLPRGTWLRGGDRLVLDDARVVVRVVERPEAVLVIEPQSAGQWALYAYHIGNRHQPLMITERTIVCPDVPGMEQLLQQQHIAYTRSTLPFTPVTAVASHPH